MHNEVCEMWCLISDEETAFSVNVSLRWSVNDLTKTIQRERLRLQNIEITDIVLWKLNDPIPVDPDPTLRRRLPSPITNFSVKLDRRTLKVSDVFSARPENHLHIIVELPDPSADFSVDRREAKRIKLDDQRESDNSLVNYRRFRDHYWGKNRIELRTEGGKSFSILDLALVNLPVLNHRLIKTLFIRGEYDLAYDAIVKRITESPENRSIFLYTGQPGTGKTLFLLVVLVLRLQEKQAIALQINRDHFVLFDEGGVSKHGKHDDFAIPKGTWTLSDSQSSEPCTAFQYSEGHLIHTSSPAQDRWKEWVKQLSAKVYVMDVWSLEEFRTLLTISNGDITRGETLFLRYGSNIRRIIDILKDPEDEAAYEQVVRSAAADIAKDFSRVLDELELLDFKSKLSSKIFTVRPNNLVQRLGVLTIPTAYLFKTLAVAVARQAVAQQHVIFSTLTTHPTLGSAAEWWFENYAHVRLSDPTRQPILAYTRGVSNPSPVPAPKAVLVGSTALRNIGPPFDLYWRPREPNFEGIDALIRIGNTVRVQQYTTSSSHRSATNGLDKIREIMNHKRGVRWHLDIVGPKLSVAESARDSHKLTGSWSKTPIHACELQLGILNMQMLQQVLKETTDDTYPEYRMSSMATGIQLGPLSTPVYVPPGSTLGLVGMSSTDAHQSARDSTRQEVPSKKRSNTRSAPPADTPVPRRSLRNQTLLPHNGET